MINYNKFLSGTNLWYQYCKLVTNNLISGKLKAISEELLSLEYSIFLAMIYCF